MHFRCVKVSNLTFLCSHRSLAVNNYLVNYEEYFTYKSLNGEIYRNELAIRLFLSHTTEHKCVEEALLMACNAGYIPCDMTTGEPRSLCVNSCKKYREDCPVFYNTIIRSGVLFFDLQTQSVDLCEDTMIAFKLYFNNTNITNVTGVEHNCYSVQGKWQSSYLKMLYNTSSRVEITRPIAVS